MRKEPLAYRMRPIKIEHVLGQEHITGKDKIIGKMIETGVPLSIILWGEPGTGKTSIAKVLANELKYNFYKLNAVTAGVSDIKRVVEETENLFMCPAGSSILFIDEIHRFNKAQQDVLLPYVENGKIVLVGATTENPYYEINKALLSRVRVLKLNTLTPGNVEKILNLAIKDKQRGLGELDTNIADEVILKIAKASNGDVRFALNILETVVLNGKVDKNGKINVKKEDLEEMLERDGIYFDKNADEHYDNISALIKSIRGSDVDATTYYLAKILMGGEKPEYIARRLIISASEDIGLADSNALILANSAYDSVKKVGMPEARIILGHVAIYLAKAKKSNTAYTAINTALQDLRNGEIYPVPQHLKNANIEGLKEHGYAEGYKYPHDYPGGIVEQEYMPQELKGRKYYQDKWGNDE